MGFELHRPHSITEAISLASQFGAEGRVLAGGTDLVIQMNRGRVAPRHLISLRRLRELTHIEERATEFVLGALVRHKDVERHPTFLRDIVMLTEAARVVGGHQVRNAGTVGGNIMNASPAADVVAPLLALDSALVLVGPNGERTVALDGFAKAPGVTDREPGEILTAIRFDRPPRRTGTAFLKAGRRKAMEISVVCVAARLTLEAESDVCSNVRITMGAVGPRTMRAYRAEGGLDGCEPSPSLLAEAGEVAAEECSPISDVRASAEYRRILVATLVERALATCVARAREEASREAH